MRANEYQQLAERTMNRELSDRDIELHALFGMTGEIGELHSIYQKHYQGHDEPSDEHCKKEVGDLLWFIAEYCTVRGWKLEDIMTLNIDKLMKRYPDGFTAERSKHRVKGDI